MGRRRKERRRQHGSAWHWVQTDAWYYTMPGTKKRVALFDEQGRRIKGKGNQALAEIALAKAKANWGTQGEDGSTPPSEWLVAKVCSDYLQYCERGLAKATISKSHYNNAKCWLNDLCAYCGGLPVPQLKKGHVQTWLESHATWKSDDTRRGVLSVVLAAFNRAEAQFSVPNPLKGLKKPSGKPRLNSIHPDDEKALYEATEPCFRDFLFAAIHTGLRPYCELASLTADEVEMTPRGMMWRVYSSKTKKTRKIPIRPEVAALTARLMKTAPRGSRLPLFRNTQGKPWQRMTGVVRFIALREKLQWHLDPMKSKHSSYSCRHTFAHRMLSGFWTNGVGCSIETLAELMGDTPKVAFDHYGKEWGQHYQAPLWNAIGEGGEGTEAVAATTARKSSVAKRKSATPKTRSSKPR